MQYIKYGVCIQYIGLILTSLMFMYHLVSSILQSVLRQVLSLF
jgi:hypothetical protein